MNLFSSTTIVCMAFSLSAFYFSPAAGAAAMLIACLMAIVCGFTHPGTTHIPTLTPAFSGSILAFKQRMLITVAVLVITLASFLCSTLLGKGAAAGTVMWIYIFAATAMAGYAALQLMPQLTVNQLFLFPPVMAGATVLLSALFWLQPAPLVATFFIPQTAAQFAVFLCMATPFIWVWVLRRQQALWPVLLVPAITAPASGGVEIACLLLCVCGLFWAYYPWHLHRQRLLLQTVHLSTLALGAAAGSALQPLVWSFKPAYNLQWFGQVPAIEWVRQWLQFLPDPALGAGLGAITATGVYTPTPFTPVIDTPLTYLLLSVGLWGSGLLLLTLALFIFNQIKTAAETPLFTNDVLQLRLFALAGGCAVLAVVGYAVFVPARLSLWWLCMLGSCLFLWSAAIYLGARTVSYSREKQPSSATELSLPHTANQAPQVSILLYCRNDAQGVDKTLRNLQQQSLSDWEVIVVNDTSDIITTQTIAALAAHDSRIVTLHTTQPVGAAAGYQAAQKQARGAFVAFLACGDTWHPDKLKLQLAAITQHQTTLCATAFAAQHPPTTQGTAQASAAPIQAVTYPMLATGAPIALSSILYRQPTGAAHPASALLPNIAEGYMWAWLLFNLQHTPSISLLSQQLVFVRTATPEHSWPQNNKTRWHILTRQLKVFPPTAAVYLAGWQRTRLRHWQQQHHPKSKPDSNEI